MHPVPRTCAGMHAEAAVQAREMQSDGWPWMASRAASVRPHVPSHGDVNHVPERPHHQHPSGSCASYVMSRRGSKPDIVRSRPH